jgi:Pectin methylesterase
MQYIFSESDKVYQNKLYSGSIGAKQIHSDGRPVHTFRTQTVLVDGNNIVFKNCIFENTVGSGKEHGQAIALYLDGDNILLEECIIRANQDTLFLAPLPEKEMEKDGFIGPKQFTPRTTRTFRFKKCIIEGSVDFIFGGATAFFDDCDFVSVDKGWVFAPSTPENVDEGFVARNCRFLCKENVPDQSCFIARPWREYAKVKLINCFLGSHIHPRGWDDWGKEYAHETSRFEETGSFGPGAENRDLPDWVSAE